MSSIDDIVADKDAGHIELHIMPTSNEHQRRVVMGVGGNVQSDQAVWVRDLPAHIARILAGTAVPDNVLAFARYFFGKK